MPIEPQASVGRPRKISPTRISRYLNSLVDGNYKNTAANASGLSIGALQTWRNRGIAEYNRVEKLYGIEIEDEIADWLSVFPANFQETNPLWEEPAPGKFDADEWIFVLFMLFEKKAMDLAEEKLLKVIRKAGTKGQWQAAAWVLERTRRDKFGRVQSLEHSGPDGAPIQQEISADALLERIKGIKAEQENKNK